MKSDANFKLVASVMTTGDAFLRESQRLFRPFGTTGAQYNVLNVLMAHPEGLSQRELGDLLVVDRSNVTGLLDRLEKLGWVRREDDPHDRRVYRIFITPAGHACWKKVNPVYLKAVARITEGLGDAQMRAAHQVLIQLEKRATHLREGKGRSKS